MRPKLNQHRPFHFPATAPLLFPSQPDLCNLFREFCEHHPGESMNKLIFAATILITCTAFAVMGQTRPAPTPTPAPRPAATPAASNAPVPETRIALIDT